MSTLADFNRLVVKGRLSFNAPTIMQGSNTLYEEGDDADEDLAQNLPLVLSACPAGGVRDGSVIDIGDQTQDLTVRERECLTQTRTFILPLEGHSMQFIVACYSFISLIIA